MKKSTRVLIFVLLAALILSAGIVLGNKLTNQSEAAFLDKYGLSGLSVEEMVSKLDSTTSDPSGLRASITGESLVLSDGSKEVRFELPKDKFYLSFAPYINQTHPCGFHSLSSCQGELVNQQVHAVIKDSEGNEIVNSDFTTMENGFIGVWLPSDIKATVTVSYNGLVAQAPIATYADSETCLTTPLQLN